LYPSSTKSCGWTSLHMANSGCNSNTSLKFQQYCIGFVELYRQCRSKVIVFVHICVVRNATLCLCALAHKTIAAVTIISVWYLFKYKRSRHLNKKCIYQYTMLCISVLNQVDLQYQEHL